MLINAFFDESGKFPRPFHRHLQTPQDFKSFQPFGHCWNRELFRAGLKHLTMKEVLKFNMPLLKRPAKGLTKRIKALMPFIYCMKKNLSGVVFSTAVDVGAFKNASSNIRQIWGDNPHYLAFTRTL